MNILFYQHQFPAIGGIETVTATLANAFTQVGHHITILSHRHTESGSVSASLRPEVSVVHMPGTESLSRRNTCFLQEIIRRREIDLVVFQDSYAPIERNLFVSGLTTPVVVCEHSAPFRVRSYGTSGRPSLRNMIGRLKFSLSRERIYRKEGMRRRFLYEKCARYVLLSNRFFGEFRAVTRLADTRKLMDIPNPFPVVARGALEERRNEVVFVATLAPWKGCDLLLAAWRKVCQREKNWTLTIVGDGPERQKLKGLANSFGLNNVFFEGYQADSAPYFSRAKILAFPSRFEGWGLVLLEAMAQGCVPVAFDSYSSVHDIIQNDVNGALVPAFDVNAYAEKLMQLMCDERLREQLQSRAREKPQEFDVENVVARWKVLFADIRQHRHVI